jgi:transposase-like protein
MSKKRRQHSPDLKAKVGLEALKGIEPVHAIASRYEVHPVQVSQWKKEAVERLPEVFARKADHDAESAKEREGARAGALRGDWPAQDGAGVA